MNNSFFGKEAPTNMNTARSLLVAFGWLLVCSLEANCATIEAQSPEQWAVQVAVEEANDGDTVIIPDGSATWNSPVTLSKALTIIGAGKGKTIITLDYVNGFEIDGVLGKFYRIANLTFRGNCMDNGNYGAFIRVTGTSQTWRVDHIHFESTTGISRTAMIRVDGYTYGVIDNCKITGSVAVHPFLMLFDGYVFAPQDGGTRSWRRPLSLGTTNAVYLEQNEVTYDTFVPTSANPLIDGHSGSRLVFRYNKVKNAHLGGHGPQTVGGRGMLSWEVYENNFEFTSNVWCPIIFRGGTGVVYNNHFNANENSITQGPICIQYYRSEGQGSGDPWLNSCDDVAESMCDYLWGADTGESNTCSDRPCPDDSPCVQIDGNSDGTGYPCRDQIGIAYNGVDDVLQASSPAYEWNNTCVSGPWDACPDDGNADFALHATSTNHVQLSRDYFNDTYKPGYTAYSYPHRLVKCACDLNRDGFVNVVDLGFIRRNLGQSGPNLSDLNGDGFVNVVDLGIVRRHLGLECQW